MKLSVAPVFPLWLIVVLVLLAMGLRVAGVVAVRRRRGRLPEGRTWLRLGMGLVAILCLGVAATRVGDESQAKQPPRLTTMAAESNVNVFLVVDRSLAMDAYDFDGDEKRILGAKQDFQAVLNKYPTARFSVLSYADEARVEWPLSPDVWSLIPYLHNFTLYGGEDTWDEGANPKVDVAASSSVLAEQLTRAAHDYPGSANLVYLFGSSSDPGDWKFDIPKGQISGGAVFGYGTKEGSTVFYQPPDDAKEQPIKYKLNEPAMETAAQSLGIPFERREQGDLPDDALASDDFPQAAIVDDIVPDVPHPNRIEYYWLFAAIAACWSGWSYTDLPDIGCAAGREEYGNDSDPPCALGRHHFVTGRRTRCAPGPAEAAPQVTDVVHARAAPAAAVRRQTRQCRHSRQ